MELVRPAAEHLPQYVEALRRGWSANTVDASAAGRELAAIEADAEGFLAGCEDLVGEGTVALPDGTEARRLPGFRRWVWDERGFGGSINLRWQPGTAELPPHVLGHVGYAIVPWRRREGLATSALRQLLPLAAGHGLALVTLTTDVDNLPSQRVITANGGRLVERFEAPAAFGGGSMLRYRIDLDG